MVGMTDSTDLAIRMRRASFNRALADKDLAAIGTILAPGAILITGSDSAVISGRKAQGLVWKREFAAPEPTTYVRTPETVEASSIEPIALEHGRWHATSARADIPLASGRYSAKWRRIGTTWMIEAELYLTLA